MVLGYNIFPFLLDILAKVLLHQELYSVTLTICSLNLEGHGLANLASYGLPELP